MSVNDKTCWTKTGLDGNDGTQQCGGFFKEERVPVRECYVILAPPATNAQTRVPLTVKVWTNLDATADDESFAIDNVTITEIGESNAG